jgi:hypothetical protein
MRGTTLARARGRRGHGARKVVQAAVAATAQTRPGVGAHAREHAAWWARNSATLHLIADHAGDPARAQAARADAVTSQRLAEAMAADHAAHAEPSLPVPASTGGCEAAAELLDLSDLDVLEVGW